MDGRADVVAKAGKRELRSAGPAADRLPRLEDQNRSSGFGKRDRGREPVRPASNNYRV
jgi:hypothetical protein